MNSIMVVDDSVTNLTIAKSALENNYEVLTVTSGEKAINLLDRLSVLPSLILLDINMPTMNGFEVIGHFKRNKEWAKIPVIFLTAQDNSDMELEGLSRGAVDYIRKPFSVPLLKKRIQLHIRLVEQNNELEVYANKLEEMVQDKTKTILELQSAIITTVADLIGRRDGYTGDHVFRVQKYMKILMEEIVKNSDKYKFTPTEIDTIAFCSKLHDVGKIGIKDNILLKDGQLDYNEMDNIKQHTLIGAEAIEKSMELISDNEFLTFAHEMIKSHHEKWDGTGYPEGIKGEEIPFVARVMAVADVYDALTSIRPYKESIPHEVAVDIIRKGRGTHFDPYVADSFLGIENTFNEIRKMYSA